MFTEKKGIPTTFLMSLVALLILLFSGCALQRGNNAGRINGVNIPRQDFMNSLRGHFTGFVLEKDRIPDEQEKKELFQKTWRDITIHIILKDYFRKYKIQVSQQEVIDTLLTNIPRSMRRAAVFQVNGTFSKSLYTQSLLKDTPQNLAWLRRHFFEYYVPLAKLKIELQRDINVDKSKLMQIHKILSCQADIAWISFDYQNLKVTISQAEVESYYNSHLKDYLIKPHARVAWVSLPVFLTDEDYSRARTKIDSIYTLIKNGAPFGFLASELSEAPSAENKGETGFVAMDSLHPSVKQKIDNLKTGEFTAPLELEQSWVMYQLLERTKTMVKLSEIVINIVPGANTKQNAKNRAIRLRDLALELGLDKAASEMDYICNASGEIDKDSVWLTDKLLSGYIFDRILTQRKGALLEPIYSNQLQAWLVCEVLELQPFEYQPLLEVNDSIVARLRKEKQMNYALAEAANWSKKNSPNLLAAAKAQNLPFVQMNKMTVKTPYDGLVIEKEFVEIIANRLDNKVQPPLILNEQILIPDVRAYSFNSTDMPNLKDARQYYYTHINPKWFDKWLSEEIKNAKVSIWMSYP